MTTDTEKIVEKLWEAHDLAPQDGVCPADGCEECLRCSIMELAKHIDDPVIMPHPGGVR